MLCYLLGMGWLEDKSVNPSVIYSNYLNRGSPTVPEAEVEELLSREGVARVLTGHQPHGDAPLIMNGERVQVQSDLTILMWCTIITTVCAYACICAAGDHCGYIIFSEY